MLHILWMIIKFILILIGIILGLILFALLLILFCPVRYRAEGTKEAGSFHCQWAGEGKLAVWRYLIFSWVSGWTDGIGFPVIWDPCHESPEEIEEP